MSDLCTCSEHGEREATIVCRHIVETLEDGAPRGFNGGLDDDGEYQASCDACRELSASLTDEEWEAQEVGLARVLCLDCYKRAADINGQSVEERHIVH